MKLIRELALYFVVMVLAVLWAYYIMPPHINWGVFAATMVTASNAWTDGGEGLSTPALPQPVDRI